MRPKQSPLQPENKIAANADGAAPGTANSFAHPSERRFRNDKFKVLLTNTFFGKKR